MKRKLDQILSRCFNPGKGFRPELLKVKPRKNTARAHLGKAHSKRYSVTLIEARDRAFYD
jgi:hypothetical protein